MANNGDPCLLQNLGPSEPGALCGKIRILDSAACLESRFPHCRKIFNGALHSIGHPTETSSVSGDLLNGTVDTQNGFIGVEPV